MKSLPVLVLGMHRSGTSFLASVLRGMGGNMGENLLEADRGNPRGYHEDKEVLAFHDKLLRARLPDSHARGAYLAPIGFRPELTEEERGEAAALAARQRREGLWGWKEPRTCLFLDHWLRELPDARCVAVYRHPLEVYFSFLKRRDWSALLAVDAVFEAYASYNDAILRARASAPERFLILNATTAFSNLPELAATLAKFLDQPTPDPAALPEFFAGEFSGLGITEEQHRLMSVVHPSAAAAYERMQALALEAEEFSDDGTRTPLPPALVSLVCATLEARDEGLAALAGDVAEAAVPGEAAGADTAQVHPMHGDRIGLHGLIETLCLNVPPATLQRLKAEIVGEIEAEHAKLRSDRDRYVGLYKHYFDLYERYYPLYENYYQAWKGADETLARTRRWINEELMPLARQADSSEGRARQARDLRRMVEADGSGPLTRANVVRKHLALPRDDAAFKDHLLEGAEPRRALGATSLEEQLYTEWVAANLDLSAGAVVDLGSWLGSLTVSLARGIRRNPSAAARVAAGERFIHAHDIFDWQPSFDDWVRETPYAGRYQPGDDFRDAFAAETREHAGLIETHKMNLTDARWNGGPIGLLVNDAWKKLPIAESCVRAFFPRLAPGSLLLHQDYLWFGESFIHIAMFRLREWFEPVFQVPNGTTCAFICKRPVEVPPPMPLSYDDISLEEIDDAFLWSSTFVDDLARQVLPLGQAWLLHEKGETALAREIARPVTRCRNLYHGFIKWQLQSFKDVGLGGLLE